MSGDRQFTDQEAEQILSRAARGASGGVSEERLVQMADELGISREAVTAAVSQVLEESQEIADRKEFAIYQRRSFMSHLMTYAVTTGGLMAFNYLDDHRITWAWWVLIGWGIGVLNQFRETFAKGSEDYERSFRKWRDKRRTGQRVGFPLHSAGIYINTNPSSKAERTVSRMPELMAIVETEVLRENLGKIEAIKRVREQSGSSLVEAKAAVEEFDRTNPGIIIR